ncbi:hypothetical protein BGZ63DRAFT_465011 [Mariannaea sp. PMI_226]|nr:hypothetical protein BGZ63DRAFT_465011 [Mariannaea sp. PMI_226]
MEPYPINCVICGCPFQIPISDPSQDDEAWTFKVPAEDKRKQWLLNSRFISITTCLEEFTSDPFEMPENHSTIDGLFVSGHAEYSSPTSFSLNGVKFEALAIARNGRDMLFPLHEVCFEIVQRAITRHLDLNVGSTLSLASIYRVLCAQYANDVKRFDDGSPFYGQIGVLYHKIGLFFRHRYHGTISNWFDGHLGWVRNNTNEWYCNDPMQIPVGVASPVWQLLPKLLSEPKQEAEQDCSAISSTLNPQIGQHSPLEELPLEILQLILSFLPTQAILRLRRCSKTLKAHIVLNQESWRTQLLTGSIVPFLWDLPKIPAAAIESPSPDWKRLAQNLVQKGCRFEGPPPNLAPESWGFWNRIRIWALVNYLIQWAERGDVEPPPYPILPSSRLSQFLSRIYNWFTGDNFYV